MDKNTYYLSNLINELIKNNGYEVYFQFEKIKKDWKIFVGDVAADKIKLKALDGCTLRLKTNSSVWRSEFTIRKKEIINKINDFYKKEIIKDITFY